MLLIIRQYLALLKESEELDAILPNLLLTMGIEPIILPQIGVRQNGTDIAAIGSLDGGPKSLFVFVVKRGDIGRTDWDSGPQSVRQTLNEVKDVVLNSSLAAKYKSLPKHIILCTGGMLKQTVENQWHGYIQNNQITNKLCYDFWGGDQLAPLIESQLFSEHVLPDRFQNKFRKVLALVSDPDNSLQDYYDILKELMLDLDFANQSDAVIQKKVIKALRTINICQNIIFVWAKNEGNLKPAILCSERTILNGWEFVRKNKLLENKAVMTAYFEVHASLMKIYLTYFRKVEKHCHTKDGFIGYGHHFIQECSSIFEHLGFLNTAAVLVQQYAAHHKEPEPYIRLFTDISVAIEAFIKNHGATSTPCFDGHINEISTSILILASHNRITSINNWIANIVDKSLFAYHVLERHFPISTDSFDDLLSLNVEGKKNKKELFQLSTLYPVLAEWCVALDLPDVYERVRNEMAADEISCTLQIWYPDEKTDEYLYTENAAHSSGAMNAPMKLDPSFDVMKERINGAQIRTIPISEFSSVNYGMFYMPLVASRHFRTPVLPYYWQEKILKEHEDNSPENEEDCS